MKVYVVHRWGIYRHECAGVFTSEKMAIEVADKLMQGEPDRHHYYEVTPFILNDAGQHCMPMHYFGGITEPETIYSTEGKSKHNRQS